MPSNAQNIRRVTVEDQIGDGAAKRATKKVSDSVRKPMSALELARKSMGTKGKKKKKK